MNSTNSKTTPNPTPSPPPSPPAPPPAAPPAAPRASPFPHPRGHPDGQVHGADDPRAVDVVVPTHTTRHLDLVLAGLARQTAQPRAIVVSCDTDDGAIGDVLARSEPRLSAPVWWVRRPHHGEERLCQVRNNAVRCLARTLGHTRGRVLILDGDMIANPTCVADHARLGERAELVLPYRIDLSEARTSELDAERLAAGDQTLEPSPAELATLRRRDRRARRHLILRALRLGPRHKPKLLGGHVSIDLPTYLELNGFDERYRGWGFKDDEFAHRAARAGKRARPAAADIPAWHCHHTTRQPDRPMKELPTARLFEDRGVAPIRCELGVDHPLDQHPVREDRVGGG